MNARQWLRPDCHTQCLDAGRYFSADDGKHYPQRQGCEFQRLQGMGEGLYEALGSGENIPCRIYAPVGEQQQLLSYLVRRLLENGANSSFVHQSGQLTGSQLQQIPDWLQPPATQLMRDTLPRPVDIYRLAGESRQAANGWDLSCRPQAEQIQRLCQINADDLIHTVQANCTEPADNGDSTLSINPSSGEILASIPNTDPAEISAIIAEVSQEQPAWAATGIHDRALCLQRLADKLEQELAEWAALCVQRQARR